MSPTLSTALPSDRLGVIAWWSASVVEADQIDLRDAFDFSPASQFAALVPPTCSPHSALRRARRRSASGIADGYEWHEVGESGSHLVVALVRAEKDAAARSYTAEHQWLVQVCDKTGTFEVLAKDGKTALDVATLPEEERAELVRFTDRYRKERRMLTYDDVHKIMIGIVRAAKAVRVKDGGAIFFVPRDHDHIIDDVRGPLEVAGVRMLRVPVIGGDADTRAAVAEPARASLLEEAADLRSKIEEWSKKAMSGGRIRRSTMDASLAEIAELRAKADVYRRLLSLGLDDVDAAFAASEAALNRVAVSLAQAD